tara:strand:+ start:210 stop:1313 length:1104 start_codon:yes stop_codon:yes gene_type:complete
MNKQVKICLNAMVGNEEHVIERMLNSCYQYIDYWVIQCNGNDNTRQIIENFFADKGIPGFTYMHKWDYPGINRDHTLQTALTADHDCDWILRMDADEQLEVDEEYDWTPINDTSIQCFNITAKAPGSMYYRTWFWNAKLPWHFNHDRRHETIYLENGQYVAYDLPPGFNHIITNDGETWVDPNKFLVDAVELEKTVVAGGTLLQDTYHFWYLGKSYYDAVNVGAYPLGEVHSQEYARRCIFYFNNYLNYRFKYDEIGTAPYIDELGYYAMFAIGNMQRRCNEYEKAIDSFIRAEEFCPARNEHIVGLAETYRTLEDWQSMKMQTERLVDPERKMPFPEFKFLLHTNFYIDAGDYGKSLHQIACNNYK